MASLVLGAIGGFFFGPIGFMVGSLIGNLLFPQKGPDGPRLTNLHLQNSQYGQMIPLCYGTVRVAGNIIWQTDLKEHKHTSGGKGGPEQTTYSYSASFAIDLCAGPIDSVIRIWADGIVIWSVSGAASNTEIPCKVYIGDETQLPDPTMEAELGAGNVPGNRGKAYVVFDDWDLTAYGNRIPNLNFEIQVKGGVESPLTVVKQYLTNPHDGPDGSFDRWSFRWTQGPVGEIYPDIQHWALDGSDIRIAVVNTIPANFPGLEYLYDGNTLIAKGDDDLADDFPYFTDMELGNQWRGIGNYTYSSHDDTIPLWFGGADVPVGSGTMNIPVAGISAVILGGSEDRVAGINFAADAGVPADKYVLASILSQNGKILMLVTGENNLTPTRWYKIVDGAVTSTGTITWTPNLTGSLALSSAGTAYFNVAMMENNGQYLWVYSSNGGFLRLWKIDNSGNLAADTSAGFLQIVSPGYSRPGFYPPGTGMFYPSIYVPATGYCGICEGTALWLVTRMSGPQPTTLAEIVTDLSIRAGLTADQLDVSELTDIVPGYIISQQQPVRDSITMLQSAYFFDAVESSGVIKYVKRGHDPVVTIPASDLAAQLTGETPPPKVTLKRVQEVDLPAILNVSYINAANDYQTGTQLAQRQVVESQLSMTMQLTIVLDDVKAKQVAQVLLFNAWIEREQITILTSRQYDYLEPTDVIIADGYEFRIMDKSDVASNVVQLSGVVTTSSTWVAQAPVAVAPIGFTPVPGPSTQPASLLLLNIPLVVDGDDPEGFYAAMAGSVDDTWTGGALYQSIDGGANYSNVASTGIPCVYGSVTALPLTAFYANLFDEGNIFTVVIGPGGGELVNASADAVLNGANAALCGPEIIQFKNATLTAPSTYDLTGLLRGRRGTEWSILNHTLGEPFVLLSTALDVPETLQQVGQDFQYKAVSFGTSLATPLPVPFVDDGAGVLPYAPVHLGGGSDDSGDVTLNWTRRTRIGGAFVNFTDVPLSEAVEQYVVQIWDSTYSNCARVMTGIGSPSVVYTSAMQVTDFGENQETVFFTVGQIGAYKLGTQSHGTATGQGSTNDAVISPVMPYNGGAGPAPGTGGGCLLPTVAATLAFGNNNAVTFPDFPTGTEWVISFTTPSSPISQAIDLALQSQAGTTWPILHAVLSTSPCGAPLASGAKVDAISFGIVSYMTGNPDPSRFPTLATSTTYYLSISTDAQSPIGVVMLLL